MFVKTEERPQGEVKELDEASKLLLKAAQHIKDHGLSCGGMTDRLGRWCVVKTLGHLSGQDDRQDEALRRIEIAVPITTTIGLGAWSDSTPAEEMMAILRRVALGG